VSSVVNPKGRGNPGRFSHVGAELDDDTVERMLAWRADDPKDEYGAQEHDGAMFRLTDAVLAPRFGAHRHRFGPLL
jgi:hypothetical protein